jgi:hypothetical protein
MDDIFPILMLLVFVLGPILEGLKRKNKGQQPPQQRPLPPRPAPRRLPETSSRTEEVSSRARTEENAATMVPDDLWEILTGQKRPSVLTTPQPAPPQKKQPWDVVYDPDEDEVEAHQETVRTEDVNVEVRRARVEAQSLETLERHPEPIIVSLEDNLPSLAQRHSDFHKKIGTPVPVVDRLERRPRLQLGDRADLRRAFLLQEVFGKPKGLE